MEVRYSFTVDGSGSRYSATDATGREDLWIHLSKDASRRALAGETLSVRYLLDNPRVNRPVGQGGEPLLDVLTAFTVAAVGWFVLLAGAYLLWRNARLYARGTAAARVAGTWFWTARDTAHDCGGGA